MPDTHTYTGATGGDRAADGWRGPYVGESDASGSPPRDATGCRVAKAFSESRAHHIDSRVKI